MKYQLEGSQAVARAIALCRPQIICAYPITPQTHIVEELGQLVHANKLTDCEFINVESEMAALSVAIGSQAAGIRSYTATSSQGLLYMMEAVYNTSGLGLPIVMTLGNRTIGSPINIWNDHSDAMSCRDAGWIMLFAETNQEALDLHIQAFKIAEKVHCPVMVCIDGFILTHAYDQVDIPSQKEIDDFLPPYEPILTLDPKQPIAIGTMVPPDFFTEVRYLEHLKQLHALDIIECVGNIFSKKFARNSGSLIREYNVENSETIIITMGSVAGTIKDTIDEMIADNPEEKIGLLSIISYRPFPKDAIKKALQNAKKIIVLEKAFAVGIGGILSQEIEQALKHTNIEVISTVAGLGGRSITRAMIKDAIKNAKGDETIFLGLNKEIIESEHQTTSCCCK